MLLSTVIVPLLLSLIMIIAVITCIPSRKKPVHNNQLEDRVMFRKQDDKRRSYETHGTLSLDEQNLTLRDRHKVVIFHCPASTIQSVTYNNNLIIETASGKYCVQIEKYGFVVRYLLNRYELWMDMIHKSGGPDSLNKTGLAYMETPNGARFIILCCILILAIKLLTRLLGIA